MKFINKAVISGKALPLIFGAAIILPNIALAQTAAAPAAAGSRYEGSFTSGALNTVKYTPTCPTFDFNMDAVALYNSNDKKFLQEQYEIFKAYERKLEGFKTCVIDNGKADNKILENKLVEYLNNSRSIDSAAYNPLVDAFTAASSKKFKAAPEKYVSPFEDDGVTAPTGRIIGTSNGSTAAAINYQGGCGYYKAKFDAAEIAKITYADDMNKLRGVLVAAPDKLKLFEACRNDNVNADYKIYGDAINKGVNDTFNAFRLSYLDKSGKAARQFDIKLKNGLIK